MNFHSKVKKVAKNPLATAILLLGFEKFKFIPDKKYISVSLNTIWVKNLI